MRDFMLLSPLSVPAEQLAIGGLYFSVSYLDGACTVPIIDTLVFIGADLGGEGDGSLYFQDAHSFMAAGRFPDVTSEEMKITVTKPDPPPNLFALNGMVDELSRCSQRLKASLSGNS
jgi:hypothetical protein